MGSRARSSQSNPIRESPPIGRKDGFQFVPRSSERLPDHLLHAPAGGYVVGRRNSPAATLAHLVGNARRALSVDVRAEDVRALPGEYQSRGLADAARRACDYYRLSPELVW